MAAGGGDVISRSDFTFLHFLRVRWAECDAQGIVFNVKSSSGATLLSRGPRRSRRHGKVLAHQ